MAEELKQQLAEGIPILQVFIKASQEAFNDSTIDVTKMLDMMQKGELKAAKVLPFVAKYYSEAANKGGALQKALQGNRVAMQRLTLTWMDFQNKVFQSGFGDELTSAFNELAKSLTPTGVGSKSGSIRCWVHCRVHGDGLYRLQYLVRSKHHGTLHSDLP